MPKNLHAEYTDHRNRKVDSLEHVLKTQKLKGEELFRVYQGLMNGYQQTDAGKSSHYARLGIELAEKEHLYDALYESWLTLQKIVGAVAVNKRIRPLGVVLIAVAAGTYESLYRRTVVVDDEIADAIKSQQNLYFTICESKS